MVLMQDITEQRRTERRGATMERERLARELHDSVSQALFAATVTADALPQLLDSDLAAGRAAAADLRRMADTAQSEMRALLLELRPDALTGASLHQLLPTLAAATAANTGADVDLQLDPVPVLPPDLQLAFYRIAQEALTNITKHAAASSIGINLSFSTDSATQAADLVLEIRDDGEGFDVLEASRGRLGLSSMRERADSVGASLRITSQPGQGTIVTVRWAGALTSTMAQPNQRTLDDPH
jgi:signal transduction histidine kinase